jgi:hypothetical protein
MTTQIFKPSETYEQALDRAARMWGIEPQYGDTWGKLHVTSAETKRGILEALGVPAGSREELDHAVEERLWKEWNRLLPPVAVVGEKERTFPLQAPATLGGAKITIRFRWEDGGSVEKEYLLSDLAASGTAELRGCSWMRRRAPLPAETPFGYHEVEVAIGKTTARMRLIYCPERAYEPPAISDGRRAAGLAIALYGLRSGRNWGVGDFTDLQALADWVAEDTGASLIGLNPLHAIPNRWPYNISPYLPSSAFYKNPIYLDVERVADFRNSRRARCFIERPGVRAEIEALRTAELVEYERVYELKTTALKLAFVTFLREEYRRDTPRARAFRDFVETEGDLLDRYATWCALNEWLHRQIRASGSGPTGPRSCRTPIPPRSAPSARNTGARFCTTSTRSGRSICSLPPPRSMRARRASPSACSMTWRSPRTAAAQTCGPTGPST